MLRAVSRALTASPPQNQAVSVSLRHLSLLLSNHGEQARSVRFAAPPSLLRVPSQTYGRNVPSTPVRMFSEGGGKGVGNGEGSGNFEDDIDDFSSFVKEEKDNFHVPSTDAFSSSVNFDKNTPDFNFSSNFEDLEIDTFFESGVGTGMGLMESGQGFTSFPEGQGTLWVKQQSFGDEVAESTMEIIDRLRIDGYSYGTGKKKSAIAQVRICRGPPQITVNKRPLEDYFPEYQYKLDVIAPLLYMKLCRKFSVHVTVNGSGKSSQAKAIAHGISRALERFEPTLRKELKNKQFLQRDPRVVERKKPGRHKARRGFQWVKR